MLSTTPLDPCACGMSAQGGNKRRTGPLELLFEEPFELLRPHGVECRLPQLRCAGVCSAVARPSRGTRKSLLLPWRRTASPCAARSKQRNLHANSLKRRPSSVPDRLFALSSSPSISARRSSRVFFSASALYACSLLALPACAPAHACQPTGTGAPGEAQAWVAAGATPERAKDRASSQTVKPWFIRSHHTARRACTRSRSFFCAIAARGAHQRLRRWVGGARRCQWQWHSTGRATHRELRGLTVPVVARPVARQARTLMPWARRGLRASARRTAPRSVTPPQSPAPGMATPCCCADNWFRERISGRFPPAVAHGLLLSAPTAAIV